MEEKFQKGQHGYLQERKKRNLMMTALCAAVIVVLISIGMAIWHTKLNMLMLPAMMCVIPAANFLVTYLALAAFDPVDDDRLGQLSSYDKCGMLLTELIVVDTKGGRNFVDFTVVYKNGMVAYQSGKKDTRTMVEITINDVLKRRGIPMRMKVYRDWDEFLARLAEVDLLQDEESAKRVNLGINALLSCCM